MVKIVNKQRKIMAAGSALFLLLAGSSAYGYGKKDSPKQAARREANRENINFKNLTKVQKDARTKDLKDAYDANFAAHNEHKVIHDKTMADVKNKANSSDKKAAREAARKANQDAHKAHQDAWVKARQDIHDKYLELSKTNNNVQTITREPHNDYGAFMGPKTVTVNPS